MPKTHNYFLFGPLSKRLTWRIQSNLFRQWALRGMILMLSLWAGAAYSNPSKKSRGSARARNENSAQFCNETVCFVGIHSRSDQTSYLYLQGVIPDQGKESNLISTIENVLRQSQPKVIFAMSSAGGDVNTTESIQRLFDELVLKRDKELITYLPPGSYCASSCISLLALGKKRYADESNLISFHQCTKTRGEVTNSDDRVSETYWNEIAERIPEASEWSLKYKQLGRPEMALKAGSLKGFDLVSPIDSEMLPQRIIARFIEVSNPSRKEILRDASSPWVIQKANLDAGMDHELPQDLVKEPEHE